MNVRGSPVNHEDHDWAERMRNLKEGSMVRFRDNMDINLRQSIYIVVGVFEQF